MENGCSDGKLLDRDGDCGPSHFVTNDTKFLEVSMDKVTVKYTGKGSHSHDVGVSFWFVIPGVHCVKATFGFLHTFRGILLFSFPSSSPLLFR